MAEDKYILRMEIDGSKAVREITALNDRIHTLTQRSSDAAKSEQKILENKRSIIQKAYQDEISYVQKLTLEERDLLTHMKNLHAEASNSKTSQKRLREIAAEYTELEKRLQESTTYSRRFTDTLKAEETSMNALARKIDVLKEKYKSLSEKDAKGSTGNAILEEITQNTQKLESLKTALKGSEKLTALRNAEVQAAQASRKVEELKRKINGLSSNASREVRLGLEKSLKEANKELKNSQNQLKKLNKELANSQKLGNSFGKTFGAIFKKVGLQFFGGVLGWAQATVALGNAFKDAMRTAIEFNRTQSKLASVLGTTTEGIIDLTFQARVLGETTRYTAKQVGDLQTNLARLGFRKGEIVNMTKAVLEFSQATGGDLAEAAKVLGAVLKTFDLSAIHAQEVADAMALATSKSALSFEYIRTALPIVGGTAQAYGFDIKDTLSLIGTLADTGMQASMAATAARNIILKLADPESKFNKLIGSKQIKNVSDFADALKKLKERGVDLATVLEVSSLRSATALSSLIDKFNNISTLRGELENADGAATKMANTMENNLGGSVIRLTSAWNEFELAMQGSQGTLKTIVDMAVEGVNAISKLISSHMDLANKLGIQRGVEISNINSEQMQEWREQDEKFVEGLMDLYIKSGVGIEDAKIKVREIFLKSTAAEAGAYRQDAERIAEVIKELPSWSINMPFVSKNGKTVFTPYENIRAILNWFSDKPEKIIASYAEKKGMELAIDARNAQFEDLLNEYKVDKNRVNLGEKEIGEFIEMFTDRNKALIKDRQVDEMSNKDSALARKDKLENQFANFIAEEMNTIIKLSSKLARAKRMKKGLTLEVDGETMTREQSIAAGQRAIDIHTGIIQMYKDFVIPTKRAILGKEEEVRLFKTTDTTLKDRLDGVKKDTDEEYQIRAAMLDNVMALEIANAQLAALKREDLTAEEVAELSAIRLKGEKEGWSAEKIEIEQQAKEEEFIAKRTADKILAIQKKHAKEVAKLRYERNVVLNRNANYQRQSVVPIGLSEKHQSYEDARATLDQKKNDLQGLKSGKTVNPEWSEEQVAAEIRNAENAVLEAKRKLREAYMDWHSEEMMLVADTTMNERERLELFLEAKKKELEVYERVNKFKAESDEAYNHEHMRLTKEVADAERQLSDYRYQMAVSSAEAIAGTFNTISEAIQQCSEENRDNVRIAKILGLAQVYIEQGIAIANAIRTAWQSSSSWIEAIAATAASVATVVATTAQAISSIKRAKFAQGGVDIRGKGTGTSDSIPAMISNGESVMTARATQMFKPLLLAMNAIASQPNVTLPTAYVGYNPVQTNATNEQLAQSFKESVRDIRPVVSVREINEVNSRMSNVRALDNI